MAIRSRVAATALVCGALVLAVTPAAVAAPTSPSPAPTPKPAPGALHSGSLGGPRVVDTPATKAKIAEALHFAQMHPPVKAGGAGTAAPADGGVWLNLTYQTQQTSYYCVPASTRALLSENAGSLPAQATIARQEGTDSGGTYFPNAVGALNNWQSRNSYADVNPADATTLYDEINLDVSNYNSGTMADVRGGALPLWQSIGWDGHHAVVQFGDHGDGGTIRMWDPINNSAINGRSAISSATLFFAMRDSGNGITVNDNLIW